MKLIRSSIYSAAFFLSAQEGIAFSRHSSSNRALFGQRRGNNVKKNRDSGQRDSSITELRGGYDSTVINNERNIEFYTLKGGMCPYAARTLMVLHELGLEFDTFEVSGQPKPDWYLNINPRGKVPAIRVPRDDNIIVYESAICDEYLCDYYDEKVATTTGANKNNLMPNAPSIRAKIRLLNDHYDTVVGKDQFTFLMNKDVEKDDDLKTALETGLDIYENALKDSGGPFFMGAEFTLADIHVLPFFLRLIVSLKHFKGYEIPFERFPRLLEWYETCSKRESAQIAGKSEERIIEVYKMFVERDYAFGGLNKNVKN